jgi:hypothetical protein
MAGTYKLCAASRRKIVKPPIRPRRPGNCGEECDDGQRGYLKATNQPTHITLCQWKTERFKYCPHTALLRAHNQVREP